MVEQLLDEALGLIGMISEVRSKAALMQQRERKKDPTLLEDDPFGKIRQMHEDLATYSDRLKAINKELSEYGHVSNFHRMGGEPSLN